MTDRVTRAEVDAAFGPLLARIRATAFRPDVEVGEDQLMGRALAEWTAYLGSDILAVAEAALTESNLHATAGIVRELREAVQGMRMAGLAGALMAVDRTQAEVAGNWSRSADEAELTALRELADAVRALDGSNVRAEVAQLPDGYDGPRYVAHFTPEVWQRGQAIEVDPLGDREWDCTPYASEPATFSDGTTRLEYLDWLHRCDQTGGGQGLDGPDGVVDNDDVFKDDPAAPEWVQRHQGPFTLRIRRTA